MRDVTVHDESRLPACPSGSVQGSTAGSGAWSAHVIVGATATATRQRVALLDIQHAYLEGKQTITSADSAGVHCLLVIRGETQECSGMM